LTESTADNFFGAFITMEIEIMIAYFSGTTMGTFDPSELTFEGCVSGHMSFLHEGFALIAWDESPVSDAFDGFRGWFF
jgi:hypothetical protein